MGKEWKYVQDERLGEGIIRRGQSRTLTVPFVLLEGKKAELFRIKAVATLDNDYSKDKKLYEWIGLVGTGLFNRVVNEGYTEVTFTTLTSSEPETKMIKYPPRAIDLDNKFQEKMRKKKEEEEKKRQEEREKK